MAITNLQQARQMFRYGGDTMGGPNDRSANQGPSGNQGPAGGASSGGNYGGNRNQEQTYGGGDTGSPGITGSKPASAFTDVTKDVLNPNIDFVGDTIFGPTQKYTGKISDDVRKLKTRNFLFLILS